MSKKDTPKVGEIWYANRSRLKNVAGQGWKVSARVTGVNPRTVELTLLDFGFTVNGDTVFVVSLAHFRKQGWVRAATFTPEQAFKLSEIVNAQHRAHEAMKELARLIGEESWPVDLRPYAQWEIDEDDQFDDEWNRITPEQMEAHNLSLPETLVEAFQTVDSYFNE